MTGTELTTGHADPPWVYDSATESARDLPMAETYDDGNQCCLQKFLGLLCTRDYDHPGTCRATTLSGRVVAEWWAHAHAHVASEQP